MLPVLVGIALGAGAVYAYTSAVKRLPGIGGEFPRARQQLFKGLLTRVHDPERLQRAARMFAGEGLQGPATVLAAKAAQLQKQSEIAADWVQRARAGDQNAIASISACREQAQRGSLRAKVSCALIARYCNENPVQPMPVSAGFEDASYQSGSSFDAGVAPPPEDPPGE